MRIVSSTDMGPLSSMGAAYTFAGFDFLLWDVKAKTALDMFYELNPNIFFYHANSQEEIDLLKSKYPNTYFWDLRVKFPSTDYADIRYINGKYNKQYAVELGMFTNLLDLSIVESQIAGFQTVRAWGQPIDHYIYVGDLKEDEKKHAMSSAKYWLAPKLDLNTIWNARLSKTRLIIDGEKQEEVELAYQRALNQTSLHYISNIFQQLNFTQESDQCLTSLNRLYEKYQIKI